MGTTISFYVERRVGSGQTGSLWEMVNDPSLSKEKGANGRWNVDERNYRLFAALCGGVSGNDAASEGVVCIAPPDNRLPYHVSSGITEVHTEASAAFHDKATSFRYLNVLEAYDWDKAGLKNFRNVVLRMSKFGDADDVRAVFWFDQ